MNNKKASCYCGYLCQLSNPNGTKSVMDCFVTHSFVLHILMHILITASVKSEQHILAVSKNVYFKWAIHAFR